MNNTCHSVIYVPLQDQCQFAQTYCTESGLVNLAQLYFCTESKHAVLSATFVALAAMFIGLGTTAADFLCPNLDTIARLLHMSENLAGITLLAFGNGSPDLFSTYASMKVGAGALAVGELVGACLFICSIIVGSMCIVSPFKVPRKTFLRDVSFLLAALLLFTFSIATGGFTFAGCIALVAAYACYVTVVFLWQLSESRARSRKVNDLKARSGYSDSYQPEDVTVQSEYDEDAREIGQESGAGGPSEDFAADANSSTNPSPRSTSISSLVPPIDLDYNPFLTDNETESASFATQESERFVTYSQIPQTGEMDVASMKYDIHGDAQLDSDTLDTKTPFLVRPSLIGALELNSASRGSQPVSLPDTPGSDLDAGSNSEDQGLIILDSSSVAESRSDRRIESNNKPESSVTLIRTWVPELAAFSSKSRIDMLLTIVSLPILILLRLTIPVVPHKEVTQASNDVKEVKDVCVMRQVVGDDTLDAIARQEEAFYAKRRDQMASKQETYRKYLLELQIFVCCAMTLSSHIFTVWAWVLNALVMGLIVPIVHTEWITKWDTSKAPDDTHVTSAVLRQSRVKYWVLSASCVLGFVMSVFWISMMAEQIVAILRFLSVVFNVSDAILGFTVFAIGNSLGDFIANFTIAKMGYPKMALAACFGGPLMNIMVGVGTSGLLTMNKFVDGVYEVEMSSTLAVSLIALLANVLFLLVFVPRNRWQMDKKIGTILVCFWTIATVVNVATEVF